MPHDFKKKEPTKTEQALYELAMHMQHMDRNLVTNSAFMAILALVLKVDPKVIAEYLTTRREEVQEYSKKINDAIDEIEKKSKGSEEQKTEEVGSV